jgi:hypothetical protein
MMDFGFLRCFDEISGKVSIVDQVIHIHIQVSIIMSVSISLQEYNREIGLTTSDQPEHFYEPPSVLAPSLGMSLTT